MPCRANKAAAATSETLRHLWISDELLSDSFNRFLRVSLAHRRYGSNVPGPLEARRRLAKRRLGVAASASGSTPPGHDFGGLFGLAGAAPPPAFEKGWKWQAPMPTRPPPSTTKADLWKLPLFDGSVEQSTLAEEERVTQFLEVKEDPMEASRNAFEDLLSARQDKVSLSQHDIEPILAFLQSSENETEAQLTLRVVQWLGERHMSFEAWEALKDVILQKFILRTISDEEQSSLFMSLLKREDAAGIASSLIDGIPRSRSYTVLERTTKVICQTLHDRQTLLENWLGCFSASTLFKLSNEHNEDHWDAIYKPLSQFFRPSDFPTHFSTMDTEAFARIVWQHWVPNMVTRYVANESLADREEETTLEFKPEASSSHFPIGWDGLTMKFDNLREAKRHHLSPNNDLVDIIAVLANQKLPYVGLLDELFAFWRKTESSEGLVTLVKQFRNNQPRIDLPPPLVCSLVQSFVRRGELGAAYHVFNSVPNDSLSQFYELPIKLIEQGRMNSNKIWKIVDRWTEKDILPSGKKRGRSQSHIQELTDLVHNAAYAWAKSPHLRARVAYRRVWECYRFLQDSQLPLSPLISRALVRAGIVNFVRERRPIPKTRIQYTLNLVGKIEGEDVKQEVDRMIFEYWMANRTLAKYKPAGQQAREKFLGEQILDDGSVRSVKWNSRVLREAVKIRRRKLEAIDGINAVDESEKTENLIAHDDAVEETAEVKVLPAAAPEGIKYRDDVDSWSKSQELAEDALGQQKALELNEGDPATSESQGAPNSATEAREIATMAFDSQYLPDPEPHTSDWPFVAKPMEDMDLVNAVPYHPYGVGQIGAHIGSSRGASVSPSAVRGEVPETGIWTGVAPESDFGPLNAPPVNASVTSSSSTTEQSIADQAVQAASGLVRDSASNPHPAMNDSVLAAASRLGGERWNVAREQDAPGAFNVVFRPFHGWFEDEHSISGCKHDRSFSLAAKSSMRSEYSADEPVTQADENMNESEKETESVSAEIKALRVRLARLAKQNYELRQTARANLGEEPTTESQSYVASLEEFVTVSPAKLIPSMDNEALIRSESEDRAELVSATLSLLDNRTEASAIGSQTGETLSSSNPSSTTHPSSMPPDRSKTTQNPQGSSNGSKVKRTSHRHGRDRHAWRAPEEDQLITKSLNPPVLRPDCRSTGILRISSTNQIPEQSVRRHNLRPASEDGPETKWIKPAWQQFEQKWAEKRKLTGYESWYESWTKTHT